MDADNTMHGGTCLQLSVVETYRGTGGSSCVDLYIDPPNHIVALCMYGSQSFSPWPSTPHYILPTRLFRGAGERKARELEAIASPLFEPYA